MIRSIRISMVFYMPVQKTQWKECGIFAAVFVFAMVCVLADSLFFQSLPHVADAFYLYGYGFDSCAWVMYLGSSFSILIHAFLADYCGRTFSILSAQTFVMCGALLCVFSNEPREFIFATAILSLGVGASVQVCRILINDLFTDFQMVQAIALLSFCRLGIPPFGPWIAELLFPEGHWKYFFMGLFLMAFCSYMIVQAFLYDKRLKHQIDAHHPRWKWRLEAIYRPSIRIGVALAFLNAFVVFLYQSSISLVAPPEYYPYFLMLPALGSIASTSSFFLSKSWTGSLYFYIKKRYEMAFMLSLLAAVSLNIFKAFIPFAICMFGVFACQSIALIIVTVRILQEPMPIGLSASLVGASYHLAVGLAILSVPMALKNSSRELLLCIPFLILIFSPVLQAAKLYDRHNEVEE